MAREPSTRCVRSALRGAVAGRHWRLRRTSCVFAVEAYGTRAACAARRHARVRRTSAQDRANAIDPPAGLWCRSTRAARQAGGQPAVRSIAVNCIWGEWGGAAGKWPHTHAHAKDGAENVLARCFLDAALLACCTGRFCPLGCGARSAGTHAQGHEAREVRRDEHLWLPSRAACLEGRPAPDHRIHPRRLRHGLNLRLLSSALTGRASRSRASSQRLLGRARQLHREFCLCQ